MNSRLNLLKNSCVQELLTFFLNCQGGPTTDAVHRRVVCIISTILSDLVIDVSLLLLGWVFVDIINCMSRVVLYSIVSEMQVIERWICSTKRQ